MFEALINLGEIYLNLGQNEDALSALAAAINVMSDDAQLLNRDDIYTRPKRREAALRELRSLMKLHSPVADDLAKLIPPDSGSP